MKSKETIEDGWNCVPELLEAIEELEAINDFKYEIKNCERSSNLYVMVEEMKDILQNVLDKLDEVNTEVEYTTVDDNE